jgi:hypothetical protein
MGFDVYYSMFALSRKQPLSISVGKPNIEKHADHRIPCSFFETSLGFYAVYMLWQTVVNDILDIARRSGASEVTDDPGTYDCSVLCYFLIPGISYISQ